MRVRGVDAPSAASGSAVWRRPAAPRRVDERISTTRLRATCTRLPPMVCGEHSPWLPATLKCRARYCSVTRENGQCYAGELDRARLRQALTFEGFFERMCFLERTCQVVRQEINVTVAAMRIELVRRSLKNMLCFDKRALLQVKC